MANHKLRVGSLFAGIGGIDLGLERTGGFQTEWFCEIEPYCVRVLGRHWPDVPVFGDIAQLRGQDVPHVDVLAGGFPCQDISDSGKQGGISGKRSGLWFHFARLIREIRPGYVIVENVAALRRRGLHVVLGDLAALGFDAEWECIPASAVGAPHRRDRIWLLAYPARGHLADACSCGRNPWSRLRTGETPSEWGRRFGHAGEPDGHWTAEPDVGRVAYGIPDRVDRLRALGNAVVPQIPQWIGERIIQHERATT